MRRQPLTSVYYLSSIAPYIPYYYHYNLPNITYIPRLSQVSRRNHVQSIRSHVYIKHWLAVHRRLTFIRAVYWYIGALATRRGMFTAPILQSLCTQPYSLSILFICNSSAFLLHCIKSTHTTFNLLSCRLYTQVTAAHNLVTLSVSLVYNK